MDIIENLILENEKYKEKFKENRLFKIKLENKHHRDKFLDYFQIWSNEFQKMVLARVVFSEQKEFIKLAWEHLLDEFGHNIELSQARKNSADPQDPVFEALGSWFTLKSLSAKTL